MAFSDIKGQSGAIRYLKQAITKKRIPPTLMFVGKSGTGRFLTAITFAKALNCKVAVNDSCDKCRSCIAIQNGVHPNVKVIGRDSGKISIDDVRSLINSSFVPLEGGFRVNIIDNADKSRVEAFNSMLKYLEEPPENTVNILIVNDENALLETIRSRAVKLNFLPLKRTVIQEILEARGIERDRAYLISHIANGSMSDAELLVDDTFFKNRKEFINSLLKFLKNEETVPALVMQWNTLFPDSMDREHVGKFFDIVSSVIDDILLIATLREKENLVNIDFSGYIAENFFFIKKETLQRIFDIINTEKRALLTNANAQYIMMDGIFRIKEVIK